MSDTKREQEEMLITEEMEALAFAEHGALVARCLEAGRALFGDAFNEAVYEFLFQRSTARELRLLEFAFVESLSISRTAGDQ